MTMKLLFEMMYVENIRNAYYDVSHPRLSTRMTLVASGAAARPALALAFYAGSTGLNVNFPYFILMRSGQNNSLCFALVNDGNEPKNVNLGKSLFKIVGLRFRFSAMTAALLTIIAILADPFGAIMHARRDFRSYLYTFSDLPR